MMMLEDLRLALRQICRAMGLPGNAATVVSLIVLGIALNITALRAVEYVGIGGHGCHQRTALGSATQTELKVVRTVVVSTLKKKIGDSGRRWCLARQWMMGQQTEGTRYHYEVGSAAPPSPSSGGCDVTVVSRSSRKMTMARVQC
jgi:hypothetical protein